jgi:hypothetical protein
VCHFGTVPLWQAIGLPVVVGWLCFWPELLLELFVVAANETSVTAANAKAAIATPISILDFIVTILGFCCAFEWLKFGHSGGII